MCVVMGACSWPKCLARLESRPHRDRPTKARSQERLKITRAFQRPEIKITQNSRTLGTRSRNPTPREKNFTLNQIETLHDIDVWTWNLTRSPKSRKTRRAHPTITTTLLLLTLYSDLQNGNSDEISKTTTQPHLIFIQLCSIMLLAKPWKFEKKKHLFREKPYSWREILFQEERKN